MKEEWRQHPTYTDYYISNLGRIRSHRLSLPKLRKLTLNQHGYYICGMGFPNKRKYVTRFVHQLVLEAFDRARKPGEQTRHLDGNPLNNTLDNLCWGTPAENAKDKRRHGTAAIKLTPEEVQEVRVLHCHGMQARVIGPIYGVTKRLVNKIIAGEYWQPL